MRCHTSIAKTLGWVCGAILMLGASWFCTTIPTLKAQIAGWLGLVFFGLGFIATLAQLFRRGPSVILDELGIHDLRSSFGIIPWADVVSLRVGSVRSQRFLCVDVQDPSTYLSRLPSRKRLLKRLLAMANASLGFPPITIPPISIGFTGLSPDLDEVWSYVQTNHPEKIAA
jgi:hypothetical protein